MKRVGVLAGLALLLAGCGSSSGTLTVGAARTFRLAQFMPTTLEAGKPQQISFTIEQPSGAPLTSYRTGSGPHTGVHLIIVRSDLGAIVHKHPPISPDGRITGQVTLPTPGRYRVVVDAYPKRGRPARELSALSVDQGRRQGSAEAVAAVQKGRHGRRLPLHTRPSAGAARHPR